MRSPKGDLIALWRKGHRMKQPNIHLFELHQRFYFYDVNTNAIVKITEKLYQTLSGMSDGVEEDISDESVRNGLNHLKKQGFLTEREDLDIVHFETDLLESLYKNNLNTLTLQVTQNCNLRCKYCVYSGSYINRVHTKKRMSWETAKKSIDFLHERSDCSSQVAFGFYGGEPLLEFDLIKKCVAYIKEIFHGKKQTFVITTNATLINEEILAFLMENDFSVMISLDGPKKVQDGNRVFADEESGTFEVIMKKLKMIEDTAPEYLEKITFNAVIDLEQDFGAANDFYLSFDMVKNSMVRGTFVNDINRLEKKAVNMQYLIDSRYEEFRTMLYYCTGTNGKYRPRLLRGYMDSLKHNFADRDIYKYNKAQKKTTIGGQCLPGIQRLFVTVDGMLFPCERVNENAEDFCIGDIDHGFHMEQAKRLLNVGKLTENECRKCWCHKLCSQCIARADDHGHLSRRERLSNCEGTKAGIEKMIKDYITLKQYHCNFEMIEGGD